MSSWGELPFRWSLLLAHLDVWSLKTIALGIPPEVDLLIQGCICLLQALGTGSQRILGYTIKWKGN